MWGKPFVLFTDLARYSYYQDEDYDEPTARPRKPERASSVFSRQSSIWLSENLGASSAFARDVKISGWTNVGDKPGGGYVGKDTDFDLSKSIAETLFKYMTV